MRFWLPRGQREKGAEDMSTKHTEHEREHDKKPNRPQPSSAAEAAQKFQETWDAKKHKDEPHKTAYETKPASINQAVGMDGVVSINEPPDLAAPGAGKRASDEQGHPQRQRQGQG
jgi:hypothetical protein